MNSLDNTIPSLREEKGKDSEWEEILAECYNNTMFMAKLLFPALYFAPMSDLHKRAFDFLDNCKCPRKALSGPRGLMKTTIAKTYIVKRIVFRDRRFIGYLTNSGDISITVSDAIKDMLTGNVEIRKIFGDVSAKKADNVKEKWSMKAWIANGWTYCLPRGYRQQVNGLTWGAEGIRPDLWWVDDFDDRIEVKSEIQRKARREWFFSTLMYSFSQYQQYQDYEIFFTDTMKHEDCLLAHLAEDPDWEYLPLPVCNEKYETLAPAFKSQEELDKEIAGHRERKTLDVFAREMMMLPSSNETGAFRSSYFKYYNENDESFVKEVRPRLINVLLWDPSKTKNPTSAQTGLVLWGIDLEYNAFYVRLPVGEFLSVREQHERVFEIDDQFNIDALGIETTSLEDHILYPFRNECMRRKKHNLASKIIELKARTGKGELTGEEGGKDGRIRGLISFYERGLIYHNEANCGPLEQQLLSFPFSRLKDVMDAAAYLPQALEKGVKYMSPAYNIDDPWQEEQAYKELEREDAKMGSLMKEVFV